MVDCEVKHQRNKTNFTHYCCFLSSHDRAVLEGEESHWLLCPTDGPGHVQRTDRGGSQELHSLLLFPFQPWQSSSGGWRVPLASLPYRWTRTCTENWPRRQPGTSLIIVVSFPAMTEQFWRVKSPIGFSALQMDQDMNRELTEEAARNFTYYCCFLSSHDRAVLESEESHWLLCPTGRLPNLAKYQISPMHVFQR